MLRFITLVSIFILTSCGYVNYIGKPDGSTEVSSYSIGTNSVLEGFKAKINKQGERSVSIKSLDENQTQGLDKILQGLQLIIEGAAKGAKP